MSTSDAWGGGRAWVVPEEEARRDPINNGLHVAWESWSSGDGRVWIGNSARGVSVPKEHLANLIVALQLAKRDLEKSQA